MNPENKCSDLFDKDEKLSAVSIGQMFQMQASLQAHLAAKGRAVDYNSASFKARVNDISVQWRNMNMEMTELLERLPWKEWKSYSEVDLKDFSSEEARLETLYEYIDVFHFFMNIHCQFYYRS